MDETKQTILSAKNARIIALLSSLLNKSIEEAADVFYNSEIAQMIQDGVSDLHCRSDEYLANEIFLEYSENM